ncbi:glutathione S-transferase family protein [Pelagibius sp. Alg239-R121]|uniref:glutathione S-transferase family protein n=1 Tax=Pelagibius sp. Alg239-R121 TaxID=2993448 RepID=UPI0024A6D13A|nr:glutathione S-transferase family protein [Pelagibius sp. Alg239-R121]
MVAKLTYFRGRGRAETTRWMLAASGVAFMNVPIDTPEELASLRAAGKLPFDQMPLLEIDGHQLSQSSAMIRCLARRGGLYGGNDTDAMWADMIAGVVADFAETAMQAAFKPSPEIAIAELEGRFAKFGPRFEARITAQGSGFCAADKMTFADVVLAEALSSYLEWLPDLLDCTPNLKDLYERITSEPSIASYLDSDLRYPKPGDDYVIAAARVLQRALPPHMPDAARFMV